MLNFAIRTGKKAGEYLLTKFRSELLVEHKGRIDLVTSADKEAQNIIVREIEERFPDHTIVAEEEGLRKERDGQYTWYIDPLDGTVNFVHGIPIFCVSIAVYKSGEPFIGVCYNPVADELFYAQTGKGAYLKEERIRVSETDQLVDALVVTGFPYSTDDTETLLARFSRVLREVQGIRRLGSAALDLCYVAEGRFDAFWETGLNPWDIAAGVVILLEAGGKISSSKGTSFHLEGKDILASNKRIHDELSQLM